MRREGDFSGRAGNDVRVQTQALYEEAVLDVFGAEPEGYRLALLQRA
jgi:hypothetical protein